MFDKLLHHKLLHEGLEGQGVITKQKVEGMKGDRAYSGFYLGIEGHMKFEDGTEGAFSSMGLDTSKLGDLEVGTIIPVRYSADHKHVVVDVLKLEARHTAWKRKAADFEEQRRQREIASADAKLDQANKRGHHG
ncbi:hypothetical protein [Streptacidiphilus neutrinimicus]|uniref:hypothetical protein n=1 Tax=Streptacidiphilus neutrinimicus TaxID=105420 RepID=UPI0005A93D31|nr:hypothetical protein [Streptacidiphilus neutrinimicus]